MRWHELSSASLIERASRVKDSKGAEMSELPPNGKELENRGYVRLAHHTLTARYLCFGSGPITLNTYITDR